MTTEKKENRRERREGSGRRQRYHIKEEEVYPGEVYPLRVKNRLKRQEKNRMTVQWYLQETKEAHSFICKETCPSSPELCSTGTLDKIWALDTHCAIWKQPKEIFVKNQSHLMLAGMYSSKEKQKVCLSSYVVKFMWLKQIANRTLSYSNRLVNLFTNFGVVWFHLYITYYYSHQETIFASSMFVIKSYKKLLLLISISNYCLSS